MELGIVGDLAPKLLIPPPMAITGGFRIVELAALALCDKVDRVIVYVDGPDLGLPLVLDKFCRLEVRFQRPPDDVVKVDVGVAPYLLASTNLRCAGVDLGLGGEPLRECTRLESYADLVEANVKLMELAISKLKALGFETVRGEARGVVKGDVVLLGKAHEYTYISGPAIVGPESEALPFSYVRPGSVLYFGVKARDEVKNSILDAFVHKEHHGYLGDSYVSAFVNFGAGTTVSNLKNTLGLIRPSYAGRGYRKLGPIVGEFVKTAIGTLIYGGKYVGPLSHLYGVVDRDIAPLTIYRNGVEEPMSEAKLPELLRRDLSRFGLEHKLEVYLKRLGIVKKEE
ncbi:sugar phosphate nucleotidyl transferase [Thermoproteus tenax]|uniref:Sugar phosphate nucleotidyl transferase n=2 Tax=Thermoproteus tenax TaxID=2271 RepID=G4RKF7_THETK|nr:sugar phosphate nucleotidyl transferase [Thermoproteus tenax]CAF18481.1 sugar phosphate nucleotidyl transferase [Thermoproteus tenax]CCC82052.1 sugar phosphate nucleotidyl transferase [Thermoproteus tenax Kra 1]